MIKKGTILQCIRTKDLMVPGALKVGHLYVVQRDSNMGMSSTVTIRVGLVNLSFYLRRFKIILQP